MFLHVLKYKCTTSTVRSSTINLLTRHVVRSSQIEREGSRLHPCRTSLPIFFKRMSVSVERIFFASELFIPLLLLLCQCGLESIGLTPLKIEGSGLQKSCVLRNEDVFDV